MVDPEPGTRIVRTTRDGVAYVAREVIVRGEAALQRLWEVTGHDGPVADEWPSERIDRDWARVSGIEDVVSVVEVLRAEGHIAQPNHVFPAHACGLPCPPHPAVGWSALEGDLGAHPFRANPFRANPFRANPFRANPFRANSGDSPQNSARPAPGRDYPDRPLTGSGRHPRVAVLDTGVAAGQQRPSLLGPTRITGEKDEPDRALEDLQGNQHAKDGYLDPVAGHGTFIAGLVEQLAPGCDIHLPAVVTPFGITDETTVAAALAAAVSHQHRPDIVSLSLGGPVIESPFLLRARVAEARLAGVVIVASAGNDGTCTPYFPAALPGVVAVGALGPDGPAPWSNYGPWVDACAPGTELVSAFFAKFDGAFPMQNTTDPDAFAGWAVWSGTSFAAPVVVAALAREMVAGDCSAAEAVDRVIEAPHLARIPCLGTVVNL